MIDPCTLIFLHIPKAAGITVEAVLREQYSKKAYYRLNISSEMKERSHDDPGSFLRDPTYLQQLEQLSPAYLRRLQVLSGHVCHGVHRYLPSKARYLVFLRNPLDRLLSEFSYLRQTGFLAEDMSLSRYVFERHWVDNLQTRMLSADDGLMEGIPFGGCDERHLSAARSRIDDTVNLVGVLEHFDISLLLMQKQLGWKRISYVPQNVTRVRVDKVEISSELRAFILEHNRLDAELHAAAESLLLQRVKERFRPGEVEQRLGDLERRNRRLAQ